MAETARGACFGFVSSMSSNDELELTDFTTGLTVHDFAGVSKSEKLLHLAKVTFTVTFPLINEDIFLTSILTFTASDIRRCNFLTLPHKEVRLVVRSISTPFLDFTGGIRIYK